MVKYILPSLAILMAVVFDSLRDGMQGNVSKKVWHWIKWAGYFPPLAYIVIITFDWKCWIPLAIASWLIWVLVMRHICKRDWV